MTDTLAQSYLPVTAGTSGGAAEAAAERKTRKYFQLSQTYTFIPVAVETMGPMNSAGLKFVSDIGRRITQVSKDNRESAFLFQRLSVLIQRFNSVAIRGTFAHTPTVSGGALAVLAFFLVLTYLLTLGIYTTEGIKMMMMMMMIIIIITIIIMFVASAASTLSLQADILADCAVLDSIFFIYT